MPSKNMYRGQMDKAKGSQEQGWEVGLGEAGESGGGKMKTTVLEQ